MGPSPLRGFDIGHALTAAIAQWPLLVRTDHLGSPPRPEVASCDRNERLLRGIVGGTLVAGTNGDG